MYDRRGAKGNPDFHNSNSSSVRRETFISRFSKIIMMCVVLFVATKIVFFYDNSKVLNLRFQSNSVKNVCMTEGAGKEILTSVIRMLRNLY